MDNNKMMLYLALAVVAFLVLTKNYKPPTQMMMPKGIQSQIGGYRRGPNPIRRGSNMGVQIPPTRSRSPSVSLADTGSPPV